MDINNITTQSAATQEDDWSLGAFLRSPEAQPPNYLWHGILPEKSLAMLSAQPFVGKTALAMALAGAISRGEPFLGRETTKQPVLIVGEDASPWDYAGLARKLGLSSLTHPEFHVVAGKGFRLGKPDDGPRVAEYIGRHRVRFVVLDSFRSVHNFDENDSKVMQGVMGHLREWTEERGVTLLLIHHGPKPGILGSGSHYRGSTAILAGLDVSLGLKSKASGPDKLLTLTMHKGRMAEGEGTIQALMSHTPTSMTITALGAAEPIERGTDSLILERLALGPATMPDLISIIPSRGRKEKTVREWIDKALKPLQAAGRVKSTLQDGHLVWKLVPEPLALVSGLPKDQLAGGSHSPALVGVSHTLRASGNPETHAAQGEEA